MSTNYRLDEAALSPDKSVISQRLPSVSERSAIKRTPLEIWDTILHMAVSCPIECEQNSVVTYTNAISIRCRHTCRYHLSEATRYRLRLVCYLWNEILLPLQDRSVVFFPCSYWPPIQDWGKVRHMVFVREVDGLCMECATKDFMKHGVRYLEGTVWHDTFFGSSIAAAKLYFKLVNMDMLETIFLEEGLSTLIYLPAKRLKKLAGVSIQRPNCFEPPLELISSGFKNLSELTVIVGDYHPFRFPEAFHHPHINALILNFIECVPNLSPLNEGRHWTLPSLQTLVINAELPDFIEEDFRGFIQQFSPSLTSLSLIPGYIGEDGAQVLKWIWSDAPNIRKLEAMTTSLLGLSRPPDGHPPITLILADFHDDCGYFRSETNTAFCDRVRNEWKSWPIESLVIPRSWDDLRRNMTGLARYWGINSGIEILNGLDSLAGTHVPLLDCLGDSASSVDGIRCFQSRQDLRYDMYDM